MGEALARPGQPCGATARRGASAPLGRRVALCVAGLLAGAAACAAASKGAQAEVASPARISPPVQVKALRFAQSRAAATVKIEMGAEVAFRVFTLDHPMRVVVDFPQLDWRPDAPRVWPARPLVSGLRFGLLGQGRSRLVIDLAAPAKPVRAGFAPAAGGARFTLTLAPEAADRFAASAGWPPGAAPPHPPPPSPVGDARPVVAIDPGHGGVDPGAIRGETQEKRVTLRFALDLRDAIEAAGRFRVVMTRETDMFVALRDRVRLARAAGADLFLSIHVNTVARGDASGVSIYTLSAAASDAEAAALAAFENRADILAGVDLGGEGDDVARVLLDLAQRRVNAESERLAGALAAGLAPIAPLLRDRGRRAAGFRVLRSPDMPSALLELGFMSNAADLANLDDPAWRARVAAALATALDAWAQAAPGAAAGE